MAPLPVYRQALVLCSLAKSAKLVFLLCGARWFPRDQGKPSCRPMSWRGARVCQSRFPSYNNPHQLLYVLSIRLPPHHHPGLSGQASCRGGCSGYCRPKLALPSFASRNSSTLVGSKPFSQSTIPLYLFVPTTLSYTRTHIRTHRKREETQEDIKAHTSPVPFLNLKQNFAFILYFSLSAMLTLEILSNK